MNEFERELRGLREQLQLEEQLKADQAAQLATQVAAERRRRELERRQELERSNRELFDRDIRPIIPGVGRLILGLANAQWGQGQYGENFNCTPETLIVSWLVGRTYVEYHKRALFGLLRPLAHWTTNLDFQPDWYQHGSCYRETFRINLGKRDDGSFFFGSYAGVTNGINEDDLKELLKQQFLSGPQKESLDWKNVPRPGPYDDTRIGPPGG